jgi:hypothetical protein
MDLKWDYQLKPGERANPAVFHRMVDLPEDFIFPTDEMLLKIFTGRGRQIKTWGRTPGKKEFDPHWIGIRGATTLHYDPAYPRYSHHLKIRVDEGISVWGLSREKLTLRRGLFYILDAHSPHQVLSEGPDKLGFNIAISMDAKAPLEVASTIAQLIEYGRSTDFMAV